MPDDLIRLSASEAVARLRRKEVSPLELIDAAEARIAAVDGAVNALPTLCLDRARAHARDLIAGHKREAENEPGWLAGLPVAIKDLVDVAGVRTTYGSPIFRDHVPAASHPLVERIERKGGIVIGKSNTPEFGAGGNTFNEVFGRTRNPWNSRLAWAERERAQLFRRFAAFFRDWDVLVTPGAPTPAWDVMLRARNEVDGVKLGNYIAGSVLTSAVTLTSCPAVSVPCGFDRHARPIGLQIIAPARGEAIALVAAALFEQASGLDRMLPIEPRAGTVPT